MKSSKTTKLYIQRPGSSARMYDYENSNLDSSGRISKIPKLPKRTYSLEGKSTSHISKNTNSRNKMSSTSMIPRLGISKQNKKNTSPNNDSNGSALSPKLRGPQSSPDNKKRTDNGIPKIKERTKETLKQPAGNHQPLSLDESPPSLTGFNCSSGKAFLLEGKVRKDFKNFKESVFKIPEYWTDAGDTVTSILKNAINIITKQYPTADVESFENDIQNVLKATEAVKQQILFRIENIVNKANYLYNEKSLRDTTGEQDLKKISKKMEILKNEVNVRKNVFGDLFKYGSEMKELLEMEQLLKQRTSQKEYPTKEPSKQEGLDSLKSNEKSKTALDNNHLNQSCGDVIQDNLQQTHKTDEKASQTIYSWTEDLNTREKDLKELNRQILELHQLCKEHLSKFKNINLQIKMKGVANKSRQQHSTKDVSIFNVDELEGRNDLSLNYTSEAKQKELLRKDKVITQQKKLLQVRDELIGMLKNRCKLEQGGNC